MGTTLTTKEWNEAAGKLRHLFPRITGKELRTASKMVGPDGVGFTATQRELLESAIYFANNGRFTGALLAMYLSKMYRLAKLGLSINDCPDFWK